MYMANRDRVELWLLLTDPKEARKYIGDFDWNLPPKLRPDQIMLDSGKVIKFKNMTDDEAVVAASMLLRDVEVPMIMRSKQLEQWEH